MSLSARVRPSSMAETVSVISAICSFCRFSSSTVSAPTCWDGRMK